MAGRKPDYRVHAMNKTTGEKNRVGGAWANDDDSISVKLDAFVRLEASTDLVITMFPEEKSK